VGAGSVVEGVESERTPGEATVEGLGALYRGSYHRYLRVAEAIAGDVELAHDAVQEAFARALRSRSSFRGTGSIEGWVWRIVVNSARAARRGANQGQVPLDDDGPEASARDSEPRADNVRAVIAGLPERQRLVLFLRYYADLDYRRIAEALEIRPGTVGATLNQAQRSLRRVLEEVPT
jgi:RNA polymerase sigma-70 factor, ECF subfamily